VWRGTLDGAIGHLTANPARGEYVVVVGGAQALAAATDTDVEEAVRRSLRAGLDRKSAVAEVAAALGVPKRQVYDAALRVLAAP
jgi:16S rRNA (cytidine1402-2'-O)-methyltransferase